MPPVLTSIQILFEEIHVLLVYCPHQEVRGKTQLHLKEVQFKDPSGSPSNTVWCWTPWTLCLHTFCIVRSPICNLGKLLPEGLAVVFVSICRRTEIHAGDGDHMDRDKDTATTCRIKCCSAWSSTALENLSSFFIYICKWTAMACRSW